MKATRTKHGAYGGWAGDMKLKKLKAAGAKWLRTGRRGSDHPDDLRE